MNNIKNKEEIVKKLHRSQVWNNLDPNIREE